MLAETSAWVRTQCVRNPSPVASFDAPVRSNGRTGSDNGAGFESARQPQAPVASASCKSDFGALLAQQLCSASTGCGAASWPAEQQQTVDELQVCAAPPISNIAKEGCTM